MWSHSCGSGKYLVTDIGLADYLLINLKLGQIYAIQINHLASCN